MNGGTHHDKRTHSHEVKEEDVKRGVHCARLGINNGYSSKVEMVEEEGQVTFREPQYN